jgi:hypothetical protein
MSKNHPNSRWHTMGAGGKPRYDEKALTFILKNFRERPGFRKGARIAQNRIERQLAKAA